MRIVRAVLAAAVVAAISACNAIIGNESNYTLAGGNGAECTLNSDCKDGKVCLFATCSKPCAADADCPDGARCLRTSTKAGTACVSATQAACTASTCPKATACHDGACRNECSAAEDCAGDQNCTGGLCVGSDPKHDPVGGVDSGFGSGGHGGAPSTGGQGGMPNGGAGAGAGGRTAGGGSNGLDASVDSGPDSGTGGAGPVDAGGDAGPVDNTRIGTLGEPCSPKGSYACAGHAQKGIFVCNNGVWSALTPCSGGNLCDSTPGANAGSCQPIVAQCDKQPAGTKFCQSLKDLYECGLDLVTTALVETCPYVCLSGACAGECDPTGPVTKQCKKGTNTPQVCDSTGNWRDAADCSYLCKDGACVAASCGDGAKNGDETDTDCGGSCGGCGVMGVCKVNGDCKLPVSGKCTGGKCAMAACNDGVQNGDESDIDCGGSCAGCAVTKNCSTNSDCLLPGSGKCTNSKCVAALCNDGVQNGSETAVDCGGTCPADCAVGSGCGTSADCASSACVTGTCTGVCSPGAKQCSLVGAGGIQTCGTDGQWGTASPCAQSQTCASGACVACPAGTMDCNARATDGCEKSINTPPSCGTSCATVACSNANGIPACTSGSCTMSSCAPGFGDCSNANNDGCETNLNLDNACGTTCGNRVACPVSAPTCVQGACACTGGNVVSNGVCCKPSQIGCGGVCIDPQADNANCGGCGLSCPTGCTAGRCVVNLATGETSQGIAIDATNVYWTNISKAYVGKVSMSGGTVTTFSSGGSALFAVATDGTSVYWTNEGNSTVMKAAISSGFVSTLASGTAASAPAFITTDGSGVYWGNDTSPNGTVMRVGVGGGTPSTLSSGITGGALGVAVLGNQVYFSSGGDASANGSINRVAVTGGATTPLRSGLFQPASVAVDSSSIYWASYGSTGKDSIIYKMPIAGGSPVPLASNQNYFLDGTIAIDAQSVYWANFIDGTIMKVGLGGGTPVTLATGLSSPLSVAVNGASVFFTGYGGTVGKITPK